jgi:carboxypeptidase C (cathepsin A)
VGFSTIRNGSQGGPDNLPEAAQDFTQFLITFFHDIFPQYSHNSFHIAGESFGGRYVPYFTHYINQRRQYGGHALSSVPPIQSIILVNAVVDSASFSITGQYDHFCGVDKRNTNPFNSTACRALEAEIPECERLATLCRATYDPIVCETADSYCAAHVGKWFDGDVYPGGRDPYDDRKICGDNPPLCEPLTGAGYASYLNQSHVKEALGFSAAFGFDGINFDLNGRWERSKGMFVPTTRELASILDETATRVLVLNGNNDVML